MKILRCEDKDGYGPFQNPRNVCYPLGVPAWLTYTNSSIYPTPNEDRGILGYPTENQLHAVQNFDLFFHWFQPVFDKLAINFYGIAEYEVDDSAVVVGEKQVLFDVTKAKRLCWIPLKEIC